jgi:hypothetical protein
VVVEKEKEHERNKIEQIEHKKDKKVKVKRLMVDADV